MTKVLYVPNIGINLVSVIALTKAGIGVNFYGPIVKVVRNGVVEITGRQQTPNSLYVLKIVVEEEKEETVCVAKQYAAPIVTWNHLCGHVNYRTLFTMASTKAVEGMVITNRDVPTVCECCVLGKLERKGFPTSDREPVTEVGQLIAADVCGPMQATLLGGARYYVLFKDKYSG